MMGQGHQLVTIEIVGWCDLSRAHFQQHVDGNLIRCIEGKIADDFALLSKVFQPTEVANKYPLRIVFSNSMKKSYFRMASGFEESPEMSSIQFRAQ